MTRLIWVGSSLEDLRSFPDAVRRVMGYALYLAQVGGKHPDAKSFGGAGVLIRSRLRRAQEHSEQGASNA